MTLGSAIARQSAAGGGKPIPTTSSVLRKHPHPNPPPQAGDGAHFHRSYKLDLISPRSRSALSAAAPCRFRQYRAASNAWVLDLPFVLEDVTLGVFGLDANALCAIRHIGEANVGIFRNGNST